MRWKSRYRLIKIKNSSQSSLIWTWFQQKVVLRIDYDVYLETPYIKGIYDFFTANVDLTNRLCGLLWNAIYQRDLRFLFNKDWFNEYIMWFTLKRHISKGFMIFQHRFATKIFWNWQFVKVTFKLRPEAWSTIDFNDFQWITQNKIETMGVASIHT